MPDETTPGPCVRLALRDAKGRRHTLFLTLGAAADTAEALIEMLAAVVRGVEQGTKRGDVLVGGTIIDVEVD